MPGLKKLKKGKKFNYGRNRSRVRKQQEKTSKFNVAVKVDCQAMKVNISHIYDLFCYVIYICTGSLGFESISEGKYDQNGSCF